jgi:uncharacterized membrane protein
VSTVEGWIAGPAGPWLAIGLMALLTYLLRIGGVAMMSRVRITPPVERALAALPGSIVAATVVPIAIAAGPPAILGVLAAVLTARLAGNELAALLAGLAAAAAMRAFGL